MTLKNVHEIFLYMVVKLDLTVIGLTTGRLDGLLYFLHFTLCCFSVDFRHVIRWLYFVHFIPVYQC